MSHAAISVKGLKKSFKDKEVLKGVDFEVQRGEIFALLGSNGAGKTTTVNILSTLMKQDSGEVSICGFDVQSQSDHVRQSISLTGQFAALDGMLTGRENLIMIAKLRGVSNPAQVADNLLARFSLTDAANQRADQYSGGMKRRLDIAMSLIGAPAVIFLTNQRLDLILKRESKCGIQSRNLLVAVQLFCLRLSTWRKQNNWQTVSLFCMAEKLLGQVLLLN